MVEFFKSFYGFMLEYAYPFLRQLLMQAFF